MEVINQIVKSQYAPKNTRCLWLCQGAIRHFGNTGWEPLRVEAQSSIGWDDIISKPNTLDGYGITDAVQKIKGKSLSTNDYTTAEKDKLKGLSNYNDTEVKKSISNEITRATGVEKALTDDLKTEVSRAVAAENVLTTKCSTLESDKVDKVSGKGLSTNDFTNAYKAMLDADPYQRLEDMYAYGVEWDTTVANPAVTRIGNPLLHATLPVQSQYRGCVAKGGVIQYYLNPNDWSQKEDGTPSVLDGTDGVKRVHTPRFYGKSGKNGTKKWVKISTVKIDESWLEIPSLVTDAELFTIDKTDAANPKAACVNNTTPNFRGGGDRTANDDYLSTDRFRSDLGKPRTDMSRATARTYATNAGSELLCYEYYKWIFYWAFVIEYATFNSQAPFNASLTPVGYHQGGLGEGVTTWANDAATWSGYNGTYPIVPCGYMDSIGNFTGVKDLVIPTTGSVLTKTFKVPKYRGFTVPLSGIWLNVDGVILERTAANQPSNVYTTKDSAAFGDDNTAKAKMTIAGVEIASDGWIKDFDLGTSGEIIPSAIGGSATTYMCDYHWCNASVIFMRTLLVGGGAANGSDAGLGYFNSADGVGVAYSDVGFLSTNKFIDA